jgi:hypothetical protein
MCTQRADGVQMHRELGSPSLLGVRFPGDTDGEVLLRLWA